MITLYRNSPNDFLGHGLTISVEYQFMDIVAENQMMMKMERTGRAAIIIEGDMKAIEPYLEAIQAIQAEGVTN